MRVLLRLGLPSLLALACARTAPPSAPHPALGEPVRWPELRSVCAAPNQTIEKSVARPFDSGARSLVEFWSPSCGPCQRRLQELHRHRVKLASQGWSVQVVAVLESDESAELVTESLNRWQLLSCSWIIAEADAKKLQVFGLPSLWLVSSRGQLQWVAPASASFEDVVRALDAVD